MVPSFPSVLLHYWQINQEEAGGVGGWHDLINERSALDPSGGLLCYRAAKHSRGRDSYPGSRQDILNALLLQFLGTYERTGQYFKIGHDRFLPHPFLPIIHNPYIPEYT